MAHNQRKKQNSLPKETIDGDEEYTYPTAKIRETKTRNRRFDKDLIQAGLDEFEHPEDDSDTPMSDMIEDQINMDQHYESIREFNEAEDKAIQNEIDYLSEDDIWATNWDIESDEERDY